MKQTNICRLSGDIMIRNVESCVIAVHQVDFANILAANESERQRLEQTRQRQELKNQVQLNRTLQEMEGEYHRVSLHRTAELLCIAQHNTQLSLSSSYSQ